MGSEFAGKLDFPNQRLVLRFGAGPPLAALSWQCLHSHPPSPPLTLVDRTETARPLRTTIKSTFMIDESDPYICEAEWMGLEMKVERAGSSIHSARV